MGARVRATEPPMAENAMKRLEKALYAADQAYTTGEHARMSRNLWL